MELAHALVLESYAALTEPHTQAHNGITVNAGNPLDGPDASALAEQGSDHDFLFD